MGVQGNRMEISTFCTKGAARPRTAVHGARVRGLSMLVKIGVCCAAAALVLFIKIAGDKRTDSFDALENTVATDENELDDQLGRLKFVQLPGIVEVFSSENKGLLGFDCASSEFISEDTLIKLIARQDQEVLINAACEVKEIGEDALYGPYVVLNMGEDTLLTIFGLSGVAPEEGQPLSEGDALGDIGARMALYASVRRAGRPLDPLAYLNLEISQ